MNSPEVVEDEEQSPDSSRGNLRNVSRGDELERSDSDTGKELSDKLDTSANVGVKHPCTYPDLPFLG